MGNASNINAGGADVHIGTNDSQFNPGLDRAEKRLRAFAASAISLGTKFSGFGLGLGAGLIGAVKVFASTGVEADAVNKKLTASGAELEVLKKKLSGVDTKSSEFKTLSKEVEKSTEEFAKLTKESERLNRIMGSDSGDSAVGKQLTATIAVLDTLKKKLSSVDGNSAEFKSLSKEVEKATGEVAKLTKESDRLKRIMGGESIDAAVKLSESFSLLKDSVTSIAVRLGAQLAPELKRGLDYFSKLAMGVADFISNNQAIGPQLASIAGAIVTAGIALGILGAVFYVTAPLLRIGMIAASVATVAYSATCIAASVVIGTFSTAAKLLSATMGVVKFTVLTVAGVMKALAVTIALTTLTTGIAAAGYSGVAKAITLLSVVMRAGSVVGLLLAAVWVLQAAGCTVTTVASYGLSVSWAVASAAGTVLNVVIGLINGNLAATALAVIGATLGIGLIAAGFIWLAGVGADLATSLWDTVVASFNAIGESAQKLPGQMSGYFSSMWGSAKQTFANIVNAGKNTFDVSVKFFQDLLKTGKDTFGGISDALKAGNIQMAVDILWAGVKVAWLQGSAGIVTIWKTAMLELQGAFDGVVTYAKKAFATVMAEAAKLVVDLDPTTSEDTKKRMKFGFDTKRGIDHALVDANAKPGEDARKAKIEELKNAAPSPELKEAQAKLAELIALAAAAAKAANPPEDKTRVGQDVTAKANEVGSTMNSAAAQARNSQGAASSIAKAYNSQSTLPQQQLELTRSQARELAKHTKLLESISKQAAITVTERV